MRGQLLRFIVDGTSYVFDVKSAMVQVRRDANATEPWRTLIVQARQNNDEGSWMNFVQDNEGEEFEFELGFNNEETIHTGTIEIGASDEWGGGLGEWFEFTSTHEVVEGTWQ